MQQHSKHLCSSFQHKKHQAIASLHYRLEPFVEPNFSPKLQIKLGSTTSQASYFYSKKVRLYNKLGSTKRSQKLGSTMSQINYSHT